MNVLSDTWLPKDANDAVLVGRVWRPDPVAGPAVVTVRDGQVFDITPYAATMADLLERTDAVEIARTAKAELIGPVEAILRASTQRDDCVPYLLAPCDLQAIKACGVTFTVSLLERVIEEQAHGDPARAQVLRQDVPDVFEFGGATWERYRTGAKATADLGSPYIGHSEARVVVKGVPELFITRFAPADYEETVNTVGLPFYAKQWARQDGKGRHLQVQMNAISLCTRPGVLRKLTLT